MYCGCYIGCLRRFLFVYGCYVTSRVMTCTVLLQWLFVTLFICLRVLCDVKGNVMCCGCYSGCL